MTYKTAGDNKRIQLIRKSSIKAKEWSSIIPKTLQDIPLITNLKNCPVSIIKLTETKKRGVSIYVIHRENEPSSQFFMFQLQSTYINQFGHNSPFKPNGHHRFILVSFCFSWKEKKERMALVHSFIPKTWLLSGESIFR